MLPDKTDKSVDRITEIYVVVFPVEVFGETAKVETIFAGFQADPDTPGMSRARATVETHLSAVPDMVVMCDEIVAQQEEVESYRLLKFDKEGIHELDPEDFRPFESLSAYGRPSETRWGLC